MYALYAPPLHLGEPFCPPKLLQLLASLEHECLQPVSCNNIDTATYGSTPLLIHSDAIKVPFPATKSFPKLLSYFAANSSRVMPSYTSILGGIITEAGAVSI